MPTKPDTEKVEPSTQPSSAPSAPVMRQPELAATFKQRNRELAKALVDNLNSNVKKSK